jgi:CRP-like cAMP-binding protein
VISGTDAARGQRGNKLIDALSPRVRQSLLRHAERAHLDRGKLCFRQDEPITHVQFPTTAVLSLVTRLRDGTAIEVSTIGYEGTTAVPVFLGTPAMSNAECICQIAGEGILLRSDDFKAEVDASAALRDLLNRYVAALLTQVGQTVACSRLHNVTQRCARWLLMTHDRVDSDTFHLTHEFLGVMLGVRRASVSEALAPLRKDGTIRSTRGDIEIVDRRGLEKLTCECYSVMNDAMDDVCRDDR